MTLVNYHALPMDGGDVHVIAVTVVIEISKFELSLSGPFYKKQILWSTHPTGSFQHSNYT